MRVRLLVDGKEVDLPAPGGGLTLALERKLETAVSPETFRADTSLTFELPATARNVAVLAPLRVQQFRGAWKRVARIPARLLGDDVELVNGWLIVSEATRTGFKCSLQGAQIDWSFAVQNRKLTELTQFRKIPYLGLHRHPADPNGVGAYEITFNADTLTPTAPAKYDLTFPLVAYGWYFVPNSWKAEAYIWQGVWPRQVYQPTDPEVFGSDTYYVPPLGNDAQGWLQFGDVPPCAYIVAILRAIFAEGGYSVTGSWIADEEVCKLVIPYTGGPPPWNWGRLATSESESPTITARLRMTGVFSTVDAATTDVRKLEDYAGLNASYHRPLAFTHVQTDYGFRLQHNYLFDGNFSSNPDEARGSVYIAPVEGWYELDCSLDFQGAVTDTYASLPTPPHLFPWVGISAYESIGDVLANDTPIDGQISWFGYSATNKGINSVVAYSYMSGLAPVTRSVQGGDFTANPLRAEIVSTSGGLRILVYLKAGEVVAPWMAFTGRRNGLPSPPDAGAVYDAQYTLTDFTLKARHLGTGAHPYLDPPNFIPADVDLDPAKFMPDVDCVSMVKEVFRLFNLRAHVDPRAKTVYIERRDKFLFPDALDLNPYADAEQAVYAPATQVGEYLFRWVYDEEDAFAPARKRVGTADLGAYDYYYDTGLDYDARQEIQAEIFAPIFFRTFKLVDQASPTAAPPSPVNLAAFNASKFAEAAQLLVPVMMDEDARNRPNNDAQGWTFDTTPRIMKLKRVQVLPVGSGVALPYRYWNLTAPAANIARDAYQACDAHLECTFAEVTAPAGSPQVWSLDWKGVHGLYGYGYAREIDELGRGHVASVDALITPDLWRRLVLMQPVRLGNGTYRVSEVSQYRPLSPGVGKLTLIQIA